jgi:hypothetical protein
VLILEPRPVPVEAGEGFLGYVFGCWKVVDQEPSVGHHACMLAPEQEGEHLIAGRSARESGGASLHVRPPSRPSMLGLPPHTDARQADRLTKPAKMG